MISEVNTLEIAGVRPAVPFRRVVGMQTIENVEIEIARLTWAVLDGRATPADRGQLAELVRTQHSLRHRPRT